MLEDLGGAEFLERHPVSEWLGDRLDRERTIAVARFERASVGRHKANPERFGIHFAQFRDVRGDLAGGVGQMPFVDFMDQYLEFVTAHDGASRF